MPKQTIGEFLAIQRKAKGLTQQEVADMLGISNKTLSSWESGRSYPDILVLPALAELYGVSTDEILNGERAPNGGGTEIGEKAQKKLLKSAANRYSVKCTVLSGVGCGGILLLALAPLTSWIVQWLTILVSVLFLLTELVVAILFVACEKSALMLEEERSRYSLTVKRMTYKAVFKIVCVLCLTIVFAAFAMLCILSAATFLGSIPATVSCSIPAAVGFGVLCLSAVLLFWLSGRGKEFYTAEEAAARAHNKKLALRIFPVCAALAVLLYTVAAVLSAVAFRHTEKPLDLPKEEFLRAVQTVELYQQNAAEYGIAAESGEGPMDYFADIRSALSRPAVSDAGGKTGSPYRIEGNLYFRYLIDREQDTFTLSYIPDLAEGSELVLCRGRILYRNRAFKENCPDPTAEDLLAGIESEKVFFVTEHALSADKLFQNGRNKFYAEPHIEVSDTRYALVLNVTHTYPYLAPIGFALALAETAVCALLYAKKRTRFTLF